MACMLNHAIGRAFELVSGRKVTKRLVGCGYRVEVRGYGDKLILTARGLPLPMRFLRLVVGLLMPILGGKPIGVYKSVDIDADRLSEILVMAGAVRAPYTSFYGIVYNKVSGKIAARIVWPKKLIGIAAAVAIEYCRDPKWVCVTYERGLDLREMIDVVGLQALFDVLPGAETCIVCAPSVTNEPRLLVEVSRIRGSAYVDLTLLGHREEEAKSLLEEMLGSGGASHSEEEEVVV